MSTVMQSASNVSVFCVFIGSLGEQATRLRAQLPAGHAYIAHAADDVPRILQQIFAATLANSGDVHADK
jgi:hypothetical protein